MNPEQTAGDLTWAPLKGMGHYPCLRKISRIVDAGPQMREIAGSQVSQAPALAALLSFVEQSEFDDIDSLKIDYRALPRYQITTTSHECLRRKCPFFGKLCFVHGARRRAEQADIIVTNHTLLFCNIAADGGLLPTVRHWVVDEAHSTEDEARGAFARRSIRMRCCASPAAWPNPPARATCSRVPRGPYRRARTSSSSSSSRSWPKRAAGDDFARSADDEYSDA